MPGSGFYEATREFEMGKEFVFESGRKKIITHKFCTMPQDRVIRCKTEQKTLGRNFGNERVFSPAGMVETFHFYNMNITSVKYYLVSSDGWGSIPIRLFTTPSLTSSQSRAHLQATALPIQKLCCALS